MDKEQNSSGDFSVYYRGEYPKPKKCFLDNTFGTRQKARVFCKNRKYKYDGLTIVHPSRPDEVVNG
jgi:hypothetical protein